MAATITKVKILLDEHQEPFVPFVTTDSVFKDGTDETMTEYIDEYIGQKDAQVNAFIEEADQEVDAIIDDLEYKRDHGYFTGPEGPQGVSITNVTNYYKINNSTTPPTIDNTWSTTPTMPTATNRYLWSYEVISYSEGNPTRTSAFVVCVYGEKGETGETGVYYGSTEPTDPDTYIWIDTSDPYILEAAEESDF